MIRTEHQDRVVTILDKNLEPQYFTISVSRSQNNGDYLVTLSDITKMKLQQIENEKKASLDPLTNIYNRQKFDDVFNQEIKNTNRYGYPLSLAIIDIDKFKDFNDTHGHLIGDEVLVSTAQVVQNNLRETDVLARWGGEEFVILFINTNISQAKKVSEKLRKIIENHTHPTAGKVTASFGLTQFASHDTNKSMFKRCDEALYFAKENGRNRVELF
jgi:diguanylate cyclase (GGDEF)-like protein